MQTFFLFAPFFAAFIGGVNLFMVKKKVLFLQKGHFFLSYELGIMN